MAESAAAAEAGAGGGPNPRSLFRAYRYGPDYPGLAGKELTPEKTLEEYAAPPSDGPVLLQPQIGIDRRVADVPSRKVDADRFIGSLQQ